MTAVVNFGQPAAPPAFVPTPRTLGFAMAFVSATCEGRPHRDAEIARGTRRPWALEAPLDVDDEEDGALAGVECIVLAR